jgi:glycosyltransferase involved in cell wall biosynthesis
MNILFFSEQSPYLPTRVGGAENSMRLMAEGLAARGHDVVYASLRPDALPVPRTFRQGGVEVRLYPGPRRSLPQRALRRLGAAGRGPGRALAARAWDRVGRALFARRFDLVYGFYELEFLAQALRARAAAPGMAVVMRMAGLGWLDALGRGEAGPAEAERLFNAVDAINYLSARSQALVEARAAEAGLRLAPRSSFLADIGVEAGRVPRLWAGPRAAPGLDMVTATRFAPSQKRQDILVEALGLIRDRLPFRASFIGTGATREGLMRRAAALGLGERVEFLPFLPQAALWERMRTADLLAHPCDHEGVSKIILEAMMLGLPVLASDVPPLPDYVIEGETGYRVANTPEAWAARLLEIAARKDRLPGLSARARGFVEAHYDTGANLDRYEARFRALVAQAAGAGISAASSASGGWSIQ